MRWARTLGVILGTSALLGGCGCGSKPAEVWPTWVTYDAPYVGGTSDKNGFDLYARAALQAEQVAADSLLRVYFTPGKKNALLVKLAPALSQLVRGTSFGFSPPSVTRPLTEEAPYRKGWRMLGRALVWRIEAAIAKGNNSAAMASLLQATKFGFDLAKMSAIDASLGLTIVNEARAAFAKGLSTLGASELTTLIQRLAKITGEQTKVPGWLDQEHKVMLSAVQLVQDSLRSDKWDEVRKMLGPDAREAIAYISERKSKTEERVAYFEKWAQEADMERDELRLRFSQPASKREEMPTFENETRPWRRFARHFFRSGRPLLKLTDVTMARTRLLILESYVIRDIKMKKRAPASLTGVASALREDPFTGLPMVYKAQGLDYRLYSVGENLRDDGGETDESGTTPDLVLEGK